METTLKKQNLAKFIVNEHNDCGKDTYFTGSSPRSEKQLTTRESFNRFMKMKKSELIDILYNLSDEGQNYLESNKQMDNQILEVGKIYKVNSSRKGKFQFQLTSQCDTWATGVITKGKASAIMAYNEDEKGEEVTVRKSLTSFELIS